MADVNVTERYAQALFMFAQRKGLVAKIAEEIRHLSGVLQGKGMQRFIESPRIPLEKKKDLIQRTLAMSEASTLDEFALLLLDKGRIAHFTPALQRFLELEEEARGISAAEVTTAVALDEGQRETMRRTLEEHTGKQLDLRFSVNPDLLGGVIFRHGDEMLDTSLRSGLREIRDGIAAVRVH